MDKTGKRQEEAYFYQRDRELIAALKKRMSEEALAEAKQSHIGHCADCGSDLQFLVLGETPIKACGNCRGVFIDSTHINKLFKFDALQEITAELDKHNDQEDTKAA